MHGTPASSRTKFTFDKSKCVLFLPHVSFTHLHAAAAAVWVFTTALNHFPASCFSQDLQLPCQLRHTHTDALLPVFHVAEAQQSPAVGKLFVAEAADTSDEEQEDSYFSV